MTQSDKDFITRIQVSQLVTQDPYAEDFYAQVYGAIIRSRMGMQPSDDRVLKFGSGGGVGLGLGQKGSGRRPNAMQKMEQQVERIVTNARLREKEKGMHCGSSASPMYAWLRTYIPHSCTQLARCFGKDVRKELQGRSASTSPGRLRKR